MENSSDSFENLCPAEKSVESENVTLTNNVSEIVSAEIDSNNKITHTDNAFDTTIVLDCDNKVFCCQEGNPSDNPFVNMSNENSSHLNNRTPRTGQSLVGEDSLPECDRGNDDQSFLTNSFQNIEEIHSDGVKTDVVIVSTSHGNISRKLDQSKNFKSMHIVPSSPARKNNVRFLKMRGEFNTLNHVNVNHSNSNIIHNHSNNFVDFFRSRKYHKTTPISLNSLPGKRPSHFMLDKATRPFTKSSKLYKPMSASVQCKQALLSNLPSPSTLNKDFLILGVHQDNLEVTEQQDYNNCVLPIPILVHIFNYLPLYDLLCRCTRACKYWYSAVFDPALWRYVDLAEQSQVTDDILLKLTNISDNVLGINLSSKGGPNDPLKIQPQTIDTCLSRSTKLKLLNMARCFDLPVEAFLSIGIYCSNLVHLDLDLCSNITSEAIVAVGKGCPKLKVLYLGQCSGITNIGIVEIAGGCPLLQQLRIEQCDKITDQSVIELTKYCHNIYYLHMLSCSLTDSGICQLVKLSELRMLDISNVTQLSPKVLTKVAQQCVNIEVLNISLNRAVDDECVKSIVIYCSKLRILSCVACRLTDKALEYVVEFGKSVEHFDVAWCVDITNNGVRYISDHHPSLLYLGLMQCRKVTFETIDEMMEKHPEIHYSNFATESRRILKKACQIVGQEFQTLNVL